MDASDVLVVVLAILLPPVAVAIRRGCGADLIINLVLCLLGHIPGVIHALYIVLRDHERRRCAPAPYVQQTNRQATYGTQTQPEYGDNNIQQQPYRQPNEGTQPEPAPPTYANQTQIKGEKQEYAPVATGGLATKEI